MECRDAEALFLPYLEDRLEAEARAALEAHLAACPACRQARAEQRALGTALKQHGRRYAAPARLQLALAEALEAEAVGHAPVVALARLAAVPAQRTYWRPLAMAASLALAVVTSSAVTSYLVRPSGEDRLAEAMIDGHIRSLMADHLTDVASSDQHTVKPWFHGKLDIAPPVEDLKAEGFPLIGGRLDYIDGKPVAALVYRHRQHPINVYVLPASDGGPDLGGGSLSERGFNLLRWRQGGLEIWAVSDLNASELNDFAKLFQARTSETGG